MTSNSTRVTEILKYHIIPYYRNGTLLGQIAALDPPEAKTLYGKNLTITESNGVYAVNNITITKLNLLQDANTAIHGIDSVLVPTEASSSKKTSAASFSSPSILQGLLAFVAVIVLL